MSTNTLKSKSNERPTSEAIPYQGPALSNVAKDLIVPNIFHSASFTNQDERLWVPQAPGIAFRPLLFSVSQGYFVNLLRVRRSGILSRHRHTGPVHAFTMEGRWHYLEHDWWAEEGGYSYEPSGDIHTLEVPDGVEEMITLFHATGAYVYVDPAGNPAGVEDVFSKLKSAKEHYEKVGLGKEFAERLIR
jgi:2,4'-dihydroxyacetophenone dioxygenase